MEQDFLVLYKQSNFQSDKVWSSFLGAESSYLAKSVYICPMMHGERDLHYPTWRYVGMQEKPAEIGIVGQSVKESSVTHLLSYIVCTVLKVQLA